MIERERPALRSNSAPASSNSRGFESASMSSAMLDGARSWAIGFIDGGLARQTDAPSDHTSRCANGRAIPLRRRSASEIPRSVRWGAVGAQCFGVATMVGEFLLVFFHLTVELIREGIDGGVHIRIDAFRMNFLSPHMHVGLDNLSYLVDAQHHTDIDHMIEMPRDPFQLVDDISADCGRDLEVVSGDMQV